MAKQINGQIIHSNPLTKDEGSDLLNKSFGLNQADTAVLLEDERALLKLNRDAIREERRLLLKDKFPSAEIMLPEEEEMGNIYVTGDIGSQEAFQNLVDKTDNKDKNRLVDEIVITKPKPNGKPTQPVVPTTPTPTNINTNGLTKLIIAALTGGILTATGMGLAGFFSSKGPNVIFPPNPPQTQPIDTDTQTDSGISLID